MKYYKNGVLLYISNVAPTLPMIVNASLYHVGSTIANAQVFNYNSGTFVANYVNAGPAPIFRWMVNGSTVQTGASATYTNTTLAMNDVVSCEMTPDLSGCIAAPIASNTIRDTIVAPLNMDFVIQGVASAANCNAVIEQVQWKLTDLNNNLAIVSTNSLTRLQNNGWNAGVSSWNAVSNNGFFQFTASETNTYRAIGLSNTHTGNNYTTFQYCFYLNAGGTLSIYESGSGRGSYGTYNTGDILKIAVENNVVKYYRNGTLLYISSITPTLPMIVDATIYNNGATLTNAFVSNYNAGGFVATTVNAGANPTFTWKVNGTTVQTGVSATYTNTGLTNNDIVTCVMSPDLPACSAVPVNSNTIRDTIIGPVNLDFSITGTPATSNCNSAVEQVKWKLSDLSTGLLITPGTNTVSRFQNSGWNAGVSSWNTVSNNGYFQFTATEQNKSRMAGLSTSYTGTSYTNIQYAFFLTSGGNLQIYESGGGRGGFGTYTTGDVLKIAVENNVVKYYKNGTLLYISNQAPTLPMLVDVSIQDQGGTIGGAVVSNYSSGTFNANAGNAGPAPNYRWMVNGATVQTGATATYTNTTLVNGDLVSCELTPDLTGCSTQTYLSNTIMDSVQAPLNLDLAVRGVASSAGCSQVIEQVKWK